MGGYHSIGIFGDVPDECSATIEKVQSVPTSENVDSILTSSQGFQLTMENLKMVGNNSWSKTNFVSSNDLDFKTYTYYYKNT